jgi:hypothetical protein
MAFSLRMDGIFIWMARVVEERDVGERVVGERDVG